MLPLGDVVPRRTAPRVTAIACALHALGTVAYHTALTRDEQLDWLWRFGVGLDVPSWPGLLLASLFDPAWLVAIANLAALALFGPALEDRFGTLRYTAFLILVAASGARLSSTLGGMTLPVAGAMAPTAAVVGAYTALFPHSKLAFWVMTTAGEALRECQALWGVLAWVLLVPGGLLRQWHGAPAQSTQALVALGAGVVGGATAWMLVRRDRMAVQWWDTLDG